MRLLLAVAMLFFQTSSVIAGSCRPMEHAELEDTSSKDLVQTYCLYTKLANLDEEYFTERQKAYDARAQEGLVPRSTLESIKKDIDDISMGIQECANQRSKILGALRKRSETAEPSCNAQ